MRHIPVFAFIACFTILPLTVLGLYAIAPGWRYPDILPAHYDLRAVALTAAQAPVLARHLVSSLAYSLLTVFLTLLICIVPAHHFARARFPGKALLEGIFLAPALVPAMTFSMGVLTLFIKAGLADTFAGVVLALTIFSYPYMLRALTAGYQAYSRDIELCAKNLGAGPLTRLLRVELPLLMPAAIAGGSVVFLVAFSEYFLVFLIGGGAVDSYTGHLFPALASSDRATGSLLTLLFLVTPITLFFLVEFTVNRMYRKRGMY